MNEASITHVNFTWYVNYVIGLQENIYFTGKHEQYVLFIVLLRKLWIP